MVQPTQPTVQPRRMMPCLLCQAPPILIGLFIPKDQHRAGAPRGKTRAMAYCLCAPCAADPTAPQRVEDLALADLDLANPERN